MCFIHIRQAVASEAESFGFIGNSAVYCFIRSFTFYNLAYKNTRADRYPDIIFSLSVSAFQKTDSGNGYGKHYCVCGINSYIRFCFYTVCTRYATCEFIKTTM